MIVGSGMCVPSRFDGPTVRQIGKAIRSEVDVRSQCPATAKEPAQPSNSAWQRDCCHAPYFKR
nr:MAG TPA: hypothetical protein [Caudoviricetes sp.]